MKNKVVLSSQNRRELKALFRPYKRPARHSGQALLLVVLIMLVAALISAGFLSIVSGNLNQTARTADRNKAQEAARAGLKYVNDQLTNSTDGEKWFARTYQVGTTNPNAALDATNNRPIIDTTIGMNNYEGVAEDNPFYYSELDRVQGWAGKFAKFPDPNGKPVSNAPKFLARVDRVPRNLANTDPDFSHSGQLRITVVGLSEDDPNVFYRAIQYKGGISGAPVGQVMRTVSNWDYNRNAVPTAVVESYTAPVGATPAKITIKNATASFGDGPFSIVIGGPQTSTVPRSLVVKSVDNSGGSTVFTLTGTTAPNPVPVANERIEIAAPLGGPNNNSTVPTNTLDFLNDGTLDATQDTGNAHYKVARAVLDPATKNLIPTGSGVRINGSGIWQGLTDSLELRAPDAAYGTTNAVPATIQTSGLVTKASTADVQYKSAVMTAAEALPDSQTGLPTTGEQAKLVADGWDRILSKPSSANRSVKPFTPPNFSNGDGLARFRDLTQNSTPRIDASDPAAASINSSSSAYGQGQGIYINNSSDREKYLKSGATTLTEMPQDVLGRMWLNAPENDGSIKNYGRTPTDPTTILPPTNTSAVQSLEERHLRGWISPNEFLPRGVLIEILPSATAADARIRITRDSRDDNQGTTVNATGLVANKAWSDVSNGTSLSGVYSRVFRWPANGVIFAEGNVRITGSNPNAPSSLTVVSMNNIYIEGTLNISADAANPLGTPNRKLLLMARKNVVLNPTRVVSQPDTQTVATGAGTASTITNADPLFEAGTNQYVIPVATNNGTNFVSGDIVRVSRGTGTSETEVLVGVVKATAADQITIVSPTSSTIQANDNIRVPLETTTLGTTAAPYSYATIAAQGTVSRRFAQPYSATAPTDVRLAFDHAANQAQGRDVFTVGTSALTGLSKPASPIWFSNKRVLNAGTWDAAAQSASNIGSANKLYRGEYTEPPPAGTDPFPGTIPTDDTNSVTTPFLLDAIHTEMNGVSHSDPPTPTPVVGWKYNTSVTAGYEGVPYFYLASVGQRNPLATPFIVPPSPAQWRQDIKAADYKMRLATSIQFLLNAALPGLAEENATTPSSYFGFNPSYTKNEDALTSSEGFYTASADQSMIDSRAIVPAYNGTNVGFYAANSFALQRTPLSKLTGLGSLTATQGLPDYWMRNLKLERFVTGATPSVSPGYTINVNAYVVAQEGSWFVIPGGYFEEKSGNSLIRGNTTGTASYIDVDNSKTATAGSEFLDTNNNGTLDAGEGPDFNHNGTVEPSEALAAFRFFRNNYEIKFVGAIAENHSAIVESTGIDNTDVRGAVDDWMNKWATASYPSGGTPTFDTINYAFDPSYALGNLDTDTNFRMPQSPDVTYTE